MLSWHQHEDRFDRTQPRLLISFELLVVGRGVRHFPNEAAAERDAATHELRPRRHRHIRRNRLRQEPPELRVKPAKRMAGTVAMLADAGAQALHLGDQSRAVQAVEILVHAPHPFSKPYSRS